MEHSQDWWAQQMSAVREWAASRHARLTEEQIFELAWSAAKGAIDRTGRQEHWEAVGVPAPLFPATFADLAPSRSPSSTGSSASAPSRGRADKPPHSRRPASSRAA